MANVTLECNFMDFTLNTFKFNRLYRHLPTYYYLLYTAAIECLPFARLL